MRKVNKCIELLDKGFSEYDAVSKVCPGGEFKEVDPANGGWKAGKVKKKPVHKIKRSETEE